MNISNKLLDTTNFESLTRPQMNSWKFLNKIPNYTDATYSGYTGQKILKFPTSKTLRSFAYPNITDNLHEFESEILQELKTCRKNTFGYIKALWRMCQNFGTGAPWDTKFLPEFPGRNMVGEKQYARYNSEILSANDISNLVWGHTCKFMGIPTMIAQVIAKLDACGILELFSKGKFPSLKLLKNRDTKSDQEAIAKGIREFNISNYVLK